MFMPPVSYDPARDWPEDFAHENGRYYNSCCQCGHTFIGYKRRVVCKVCAATQSPHQGREVAAP